MKLCTSCGQEKRTSWENGACAQCYWERVGCVCKTNAEWGYPDPYSRKCPLHKTFARTYQSELIDEPVVTHAPELIQLPPSAAAIMCFDCMAQTGYDGCSKHRRAPEPTAPAIDNSTTAESNVSNT